MRLFRQANLTAGGVRARRYRRFGLGLALAFGGGLDPDRSGGADG